jgi:hypothetical protein
MALTYEGQEFLIARGAFGHIHPILGAVGELAIHLVEMSDGLLSTVWGWDSDDYKPKEPGFWVWTGQITFRDCPYPYQSYRFHDGSWRPALLNDFARFGLPVPLPRLPEGVLA